MKGDQSVSSWEVKIPIKGSISLQRELSIDMVEFYIDKGEVLAKTVVDGSPDDVINEAIKRVNRALDEITFKMDAPIRIEKSGIIANRVSETIGKTTEAVLDSMGCMTIKLTHPIGEDTRSDADKRGSNIQDVDKKRTYQKSLSHYRNGLNAESDGNPKAFLDYWASIEVITNKYGEGKYTKDKIYDCFEKCFGERREEEVKKLYKVRKDAAHGLKDVSDPEEIKDMIEKTPRMKDLAKRFLSCWDELQSTKAI